MPLICQGHAKVDSIIISILDNKYILLAPPSGRILRKKGKREWVPFFRLTGGTPKRKVPADRRGQQGLVKEREQQAFSRVKSKSLLNGAYPAYLCSRNSHRGEEAPPKGKNFRVPEKPVASPVNGLPRQKYQPEVWRFPPGMRSTVEGAMWGRAKKTLGGVNSGRE